MLKCEIVEKVSKNGKTYTVLEIQLTSSYKKMVFLDTAETELIKLLKSQNSSR